MVNEFRTHSGLTFSMLGCVVKGNDFATMDQFDKEYARRAASMAEQKKCNIFYNLKKFTNTGYEYSQYFLIPVDAIDSTRIPVLYNGKGTDYWIGIAYYHDAPDITLEEKNRIREELWNDDITGYEYEQKCAEELRHMGFIDIEVTKTSGDQGIDVIAWKDGLKYGIQCKYYRGSVSNKAVQEASAGAQYYDCDVAVVMTNSTFTKSAEELAHKIGVKLWSSHSTYKEV